jgi:plastocyanin
MTIASATLIRFGIRIAVSALMAYGTPSAHCTEGSAVTIDNFTFRPAVLTVKAGTTVTWTNNDDIPHQVVAAGTFKSKVLDSDDSYSFTFARPGDYVYFCSLHPHMTGTIKVE